MAQYYKTSKPTYVDDFMYQPPWELAKEVILAKDKRINDQIAGAAELEKVLNFNYLDFDEEKAIQKQMEYRSKIQDLVSKIQEDPENYTRYKNELLDTSKSLQADMTTGEIAAITGTFSAAEKFKKDHEKYKEKEGARFNAGFNSFYNRARQAREEKGYTAPVWESEQLMESMDFGKRFLEFLKQKKVNRVASSGAGSSGGYIYTREGTNEQLSEAEVRSLMNDAVLTTPNAAEYIDQTQRIGMGNPTEGLLQLADNYAYKQETSKTKMTVDSSVLEDKRQAGRKELENLRQKHRLELKDKENSPGTVSGIPEAGPMELMFGVNVGMKLNNDLQRAGLGDQKYSKNATTAIGMSTLYKQGIISNYNQEQILQEDIDKYQKPEDFGSLNYVLVPQKDMTITHKDGTTRFYKAGQNYITTGEQNSRKGIFEVTPSTGKPFYFSPNVNGISYSASSGTDPGAFKILLMPPNSLPGLKNGIQIFKQFETKK